MTDTASLTFLPWMRRGLGRSLARAGDDGSPGTRVGSVAVGLSVDAGDASTSIENTFEVQGPGSVVGLQQNQIIRCDPPDGTSDFEPNYFPSVELLSPDLPWMFTPAAAADNDRLVPWLALVVVEVKEGVTLDDSVGASPGRLTIDSSVDATTQLPDLTEAWAWSHVQCTAEIGESDLDSAMSTRPEDFRSRLVCPRRLEPGAAYIAAIVPTFEDGRRAGLGLAERDEVDYDSPDWWKAWTDNTGSVELPVYHSWHFQTGEEGDFESLVRRITPRELEVGTKDFDIGQSASPSLPPQPPAERLVSWKGALVSPSASERTKDKEHWDELRSALHELVEDGLMASEPSEDEEYDALKHDPVVGPPGYGALAVEADGLPDIRFSGERLSSRHGPQWLSEVNVDPIHRSAAGLGSEVVRKNQEALMASAWSQAASLKRINRLLNRSRLAADLGDRQVARRVGDLSDASLLNFVAPAAQRLELDKTLTLSGKVAESLLPTGLGSSALARIARPQGPLGRATRGIAGQLQAPSSFLTSKCLTDIQTSLAHTVFVRPAGLQVDAEVATSGIPVSAGSPEARAVRGRRSPGIRARGSIPGTRIGTMPKAVTPGPVWTPGSSRVPGGAEFAEGASDTSELVAQVRAVLRPSALLQSKLANRVTAPGIDLTAGRIPTAIKASPSFPFPLYDKLRELDPEFLLAGVGEIPEDTVGLTTVNAAFVEAFLLGANDELASEFAWREYPSDLGDTWLRCFWDAEPSEGEDTDGAVPDIDSVSTWGSGSTRKSRLGQHQVGVASDGTLVLILRSELWKKYPDTSIYATRAAWSEDGTERLEASGADGLALERKEPLFYGVLDERTIFFGFDIDAEQALGPVDDEGQPIPGGLDGDGDAGWFFAFEEAASGARFGLDVGSSRHAGLDPESSPRFWRDVSWYHQVEGQDTLTGLSHASALGRFAESSPRFFDPSGDPGAARFQEAWGTTASAMARITLQRPVRVLVHASSMLPG